MVMLKMIIRIMMMVTKIMMMEDMEEHYVDVAKT